jgi:hypothetical protein
MAVILLLEVIRVFFTFTIGTTRCLVIGNCWFFALILVFQSDVCVEANAAGTKKKPLSKISKFPGRSRSGSADVTITGNIHQGFFTQIFATLTPSSDFDRKCTQIVWNPAHQEIAVACQNNVLVYQGAPA